MTLPNEESRHHFLHIVDIEHILLHVLISSFFLLLLEIVEHLLEVAVLEIVVLVASIGCILLLHEGHHHHGVHEHHVHHHHLVGVHVGLRLALLLVYLIVEGQVDTLLLQGQAYLVTFHLLALHGLQEGLGLFLLLEH